MFCWSSGGGGPPPRWDLRRAGWQLCAAGAECDPEPGEVRLVDAASRGGARRLALAARDLNPRQTVLLGIDCDEERAALIAQGFGEALSSEVGLAELSARSQRLAEAPELLPRWRRAGPVTLDLFHRDGRIEGRWIGLHPREFALLWRIADVPGRSVSRAELLRDVWRMRHEPETNSVAVHVSRLRAKLGVFGLSALVATDPEGGYRLAEGMRELAVP